MQPIEKHVLRLPAYLHDLVEEVIFPKRAIIARPEDHFSHFYILKRGFVKIYELDSSGKATVHAFYGPGDCFSIPQIINNFSAGMYYQAVEETSFKTLPRNEFLRALKQDAALSFQIMQYVIYQSALSKYRIDNMTYQFAVERVAYRLLLLAVKYGQLVNGKVLLPNITQEDIADTIGLSRESVSKSMKKLERAGHIMPFDGRTAIKDVSALLNHLRNRHSLPPSFYVLRDRVKSVDA